MGSIKKKNIYYNSKDGITRIHGVMWIPDGEIKAVLQLCHGMSEYAERYDDFASYLARQGILVAGNDHLGHGDSIINEESRGYFAAHNGNKCLIEDINTLRKNLNKRYEGKPFFMLGHSMGSFLLRQYIELYPDGIDGAIISGTGYFEKGIRVSAIAYSWIMAHVLGGHFRSRVIDWFGSGHYNKNFAPNRTGKDWISKDKEKVDAFVNDPRSSFKFTLNAYYNMFKGIIFMQKKSNTMKVRKEMPFLIVSGDQDAVGDFGKGVKKVVALYESVGVKDITMKLYEGDRHEILNETDRDRVYEDIYNWIDGHI